MVLEAVSEGVSKWQEFERALMEKLVSSGVSEAHAQKAGIFIYVPVYI